MYYATVHGYVPPATAGLSMKSCMLKVWHGSHQVSNPLVRGVQAACMLFSRNRVEADGQARNPGSPGAGDKQAAAPRQAGHCV